MKRMVSLLMSVILLGSAMAAAWPVTAEELPAPYAWLETDGGTLSVSEDVSVVPQGAFGRTDVLPLEDAAGYGIRLDADWSGFAIGGDIFANVPMGEGAVLAVGYYADVDTATDHQLFRYQLGGAYGDGSHVDLFVWQHGLVGRQTGLWMIPLSAAAIAAARADAAYTIQLLACPHGAETVYIRSVRLVAPQYTAITTDECQFLEFEERAMCDYYPDVTAIPSRDMTYRDLEQSAAHPDVPWLYRYVRVHGASYIADENERRMTYIRLYATEGHENDTVDVIGIEREPGVWGEGERVQLTDGIGGVFLPSTCFGNRLNGNGSFRFLWSEAAKVARIEVYDVGTYCIGSTGDAATTALFHAERLRHNAGLALTGYRTPTVWEEGYRGDTVCAACGTVLQAGETIEKKTLPAPYAYLTTTDGVLKTGDGTSATPLGNHGNTDVLPIGDTGEYGIRLDGDWSGLSFGGDILANVPEAADVVLALGYYIDSDARGQMFRYQIGTAPYVDVYSVNHALESRRAGVLLIPLSAAEVAAWRASGEPRLHILGCPHGAEVTYIQSVRVVATAHTAVPDVGCAYADETEQVLCDYLPQILGTPARGMVSRGYETSENLPERPWLYRYYAVQSPWLASEGNTNRPVYIKIYAAEGYENDAIRIDSIEREAGAWGAGGMVQMTDGVGGLYVPSTNFTNGLNAVGSFRFWWTDAEKVARVELYDVATYCTQPAADDERRAWLHARMRAERIGITIENYDAPTVDAVGYSGDVYCAACHTLLENGQEIPRLPDDGLPAPYGRVETATGVTFVSDGWTLIPSGPIGSDRTVTIGDGKGYGIRLESDWSGFTLTGEAFRRVPQGESAVLAIEYYLDTPQGGQMFRYMVGGRPHVDFYTSLSNLVHEASALMLCVLTPEEIALLAQGEALHILGCPGGAGVAYIQSVQLIAPPYAAGADIGYDRVALTDVPLCDYYPTLLGRYNHGMRYADVRDGYDAMGNLRRHTYFEVTRTLAGDVAVHTPVLIRFRLKEGHTAQSLTVDYQIARPASLTDETIWASRTVTVTDGVAEVLLDDAYFTNGLYGVGSFRVPAAVAEQLATVEVIPVAARTTLRGWINRAAQLTAEKTPASVAAFTAVVQEVTAICDDPWATPDAIAEAEARIITAASYLVPCPHRYTDEKDTTCDDCGATRTVVTVLTGDVNGDTKVDSTDARLTLQYAVGKIDANALDLAASDVDGDGKTDSTDARLILQYAVGKIEGF